MKKIEEIASKYLEDVLVDNESLPTEVRGLLSTAVVYGSHATERPWEHSDEPFGFGAAINALKAGLRVRRKGWNGKGMFLWLKEATMVKAEWCKDPMLRKLAEDKGGEIPALGTICMYTAQGEILTGWLASQTDVLSEDWEVVR